MTTTDRDVEVGVDVQATVGLYVAAVAVGLATVLAAVAGLSTDELLALVPTGFTGGLLCGATVARVAPAVAVRIGERRWPTVVCWLPALGIAGGAAALYATGTTAGWIAVPAGGAVVGIGIAGRLVALSARDAAVGTSIDTGEPVASWPWHHSGTHAGMTVGGLALFALGAAITVGSGFDRPPVRLFFAAVLCIAVGWGPTVSIPAPGGERTLLSIPALEYDRADVRAYETGLVIEPRIVPTYRRFVPWDRITAVRSTDEHLVLERRFRPAIRCDRSAIDEPERVVDAIETVRETNARGTTD